MRQFWAILPWGNTEKSYDPEEENAHIQQSEKMNHLISYAEKLLDSHWNQAEKGQRQTVFDFPAAKSVKNACCEIQDQRQKRNHTFWPDV